MGNLISYENKLAPLVIRNNILPLIPKETRHIYVLCIGSNRINGDSVGPFVGTLLHGIFSQHLTIMGTLQHPLDATTLEVGIRNLLLPRNSYVIAVDSVSGTEETVHSIVVREGPLVPGSGVGHVLPPVGDCSIMGIVINDGPNVKQGLPYTSLHLIYTMASSIAKGIALTARQHFQYPSDSPIQIYK
ncbi:spore protease YyaC [Ectobacillus panaciterrae]|uniref:spore protease YyaC n=1 Tax=Ectobacillus panaciterrae TaxID=363872 RepID=UPI0003F7D9D8|nr:spore protease YyaC [Ectobacillus panaciterrae]